MALGIWSQPLHAIFSYLINFFCSQFAVLISIKRLITLIFSACLHRFQAIISNYPVLLRTQLPPATQHNTHTTEATTSKSNIFAGSSCFWPIFQSLNNFSLFAEREAKSKQRKERKAKRKDKSCKTWQKHNESEVQKRSQTLSCKCSQSCRWWCGGRQQLLWWLRRILRSNGSAFFRN